MICNEGRKEGRKEGTVTKKKEEKQKSNITIAMILIYL